MGLTSHYSLNYPEGTDSVDIPRDIEALADDVDAVLFLKAALASPQFSGTPTAPTATAGTNTTQLATTAFVDTAINNLIASAPGTLNTLDELAAALGDDANFASTITTALTAKAPLASPQLTGIPTAPTATSGTNTTQIATTAFVAAGLTTVNDIIICTSSTHPASPSEGDIIYETDTKKFFGWNGTTWSPIGGGASWATTEPSGASTGDLWVDSDAPSTSSLNSNDFLLKADAASTYAKVAPYTDSALPATAYRNKIINGAFDVNQRAFTNNTTDLSYNFDRWVQNHSGGTMTCTPQLFTLGNIISGHEPKQYLQITTASHTASGHIALLIQSIEGVRTLAGQTATISFWAKANTGTPKIGIEWWQAFGTGGSPSSGQGTTATPVTLSTSWQRFSTTINVPSISGKTLGTNNNDRVDLNLYLSAGSNFNSRTGSIGNQNATFSIWGVQVEKGSVATPFEVEDYGTTLSKCQRYYYRHAEGNQCCVGTAIYYTTTSIALQMPLPVKMRAVPVAANVQGVGYFATDPGADAFDSLTLAATTSTTIANWYNTTEITAVAASGRACYVYTNNSAAVVALSAEFI